MPNGFNNSTRQNIRNYTTLPYNPAAPVSVDIARVGLLAKIYLRFKGSLTAQHASKTTFTPAQTAPYNLIQRVQANLNSGVSIWNTSGFGAYLQNVTNKLGYNLDQDGASSEVYAFGNAVSAAGAVNPLAFSLCLNTMINDKNPIGLLMLQNDATALTLQIEAAAAAALMTDTDVTTTLTGSWDIATEIFGIPIDPADYPPLNRVHQVLEQSFPINSVGDNRQVLPRGVTYRRLINSLVLNGALSDAAETMRLVYNLSSTPYQISGGLAKVIQRERYGRDLPAGSFVWDMFYQGFPNVGADMRDLIDSSQISDLSQFMIIPQGTLLGANNNMVNMVFDQILNVAPVGR